jgi:hypothetical protein
MMLKGKSDEVKGRKIRVSVAKNKENTIVEWI